MDKALQTMIENMPEKTGKSLEQWKYVLSAKSFEKHGQAVTFLKEEHGVTHGFANTIVSLSKEESADEGQLVEQQYEGKDNLRPTYEELVAVARSLGSDVQIMPKKTSVSIVRKKQFALIKPATKARIDLGLKLRTAPVGGRLEASGPFGTMCTHRVQVTDIAQVDSELKDWLKTAYEEAE